MTQAEPKPNWKPKGFLVALTRKEWEDELEHNLEVGLAKPGETYEDYLRGISDDGWICCTPGDPKDYE